MIIYVAWMWLQSLWALNSSFHWEGCILFTKYVVLFYIIYRVLSEKSDLMLFSLGHVIGCFILGWIAYSTTVGGRLEGVGGPGIDDANTLGMHLTTGLPFAAFLFVGERGKTSWLAFAAIPFILNGIILTQSRGAFLGLLCAGFATLYLKPPAYGRSVYVAAALGSFLFLTLTHDLFWDRMGSIVVSEEREMDASAASRIQIMRIQWEMAKDYPWGAGHRGNDVLSSRYMPSELLTHSGTRAAHNTFMAVLVDQGFVGAGLFVTLLAWTVTTLIRMKALDRTGLAPSLAIYRAAIGAALVASFISGQFSNFLKAEVQIWLIALLAVLYKLCQESICQDNLLLRAGLEPRP